MKRWSWVVAGLYLLILVVLTVPVIMLAFAPKVRASDAVEAVVTWQYWLWVAVMVLAQVALLAVPVRVASRRPVTKGALWPTVLAAGLMIGGLVLGAITSLWEFAFRDSEVVVMGHKVVWDTAFLGALGAGVMVWIIWSVVFFRLSRNADPRDFVSHQCRMLLKGSILELLIAVPTHIVARYRDYCCAGFMTFIGLTMGIAVMLFSFGPSVFFLYAERWKRLHPWRAADLGGDDVAA